MTRLNVPPMLPPKPTSVALSELAIAAGVTGQSLMLLYQEFPTPVLCQLYKYCIRYAGATEVQHIQTQADVRKLAERISQVRLGVVHVPRLCISASWAIQMATPTEAEGSSRPALFCCGGAGEAEDNPGAALVLRGNPRENAAMVEWLQIAEPELPDWSVVPVNVNIQTEPLVEAALSPQNRMWSGLDRLRDRQVLKGLLAGATVLRSLRQEGQSFGSPIIRAEDYGLASGLLQSRLVGSVDESFDPLAVAMVNRANAYIAAQYAPSGGEGNPFRTDGRRAYAQRVVDRPPRELITRREVTDLGNTRSRLVCRLVRYLQQHPNGYEQFAKMGLLRRSPSRNSWARGSAGALALLLRPWSVKQVRDHFDPLRRAGLITAEREPANGPWRYLLPEELATAANPFRALPSVQELATKAPG